MMLSSLSLLAQAAPARPPGEGLNMIVMMGFMFVLMYFLLIRPQRLQQKKLAEQISSLKTGDKVVTSGGIHGIVSNVKDGTSLVLKIADNVKIEVEKSAISTVVKPAESKPAEAKA